MRPESDQWECVRAFVRVCVRESVVLAVAWLFNALSQSEGSTIAKYRSLKGRTLLPLKPSRTASTCSQMHWHQDYVVGSIKRRVRLAKEGPKDLLQKSCRYLGPFCRRADFLPKSWRALLQKSWQKSSNVGGAEIVKVCNGWRYDENEILLHALGAQAPTTHPQAGAIFRFECPGVAFSKMKFTWNIC